MNLNSHIGLVAVVQDSAVIEKREERFWQRDNSLCHSHLLVVGD
jgi:hypothetical protein